MAIPADDTAPTPGIGGRMILDDLFRRAAARRPDAVALIDPPNRTMFTDGLPRRLTYWEADRIVSAIAGRLRRMGLPTGSIIAFQLANTAESVLTLLAVLRAGLVAMPLPLLWRRADMVTALSRGGAKALVVSGRIGKTDHFEVALQVAAQVFSVRHVCGFGREPPDGVVLFDDLFAAEEDHPSLERAPAADPVAHPAAHPAVVTWDVTADGLMPIGRSHAELIAGGLAVMLEARVIQDAAILSTITLSSFAGLSASVLPWLLAGGTLALHHPFDPTTFGAQCSLLCSDTVVVPGALAAEFAKAGHLSERDGVRSVVGVWRAPERLPNAAPWRDPAVSMTDVQAFGEIGLIAARRGPDGLPNGIPLGPVTAPRGVQGMLVVAEVRRTDRGTIALGGPMVPRCAPGAERSTLPSINFMADGFVDTGYTCQLRQATLTVTGPPPGLVSVGGYRFMAHDLEEIVRRAGGAATLAALPDALAGHRLAGATSAHVDVQGALTGLGANPLLAAAFRAGRGPTDDRLP